MFTKILVAIANFTDSEVIFEPVLELAKLSHARLMLLHVLSSQDKHYPTLNRYPLKAYPQQWHNFQTHSIKQLRSLAQRATAAHVQTEVAQTFGDPGYGICALAQTWYADLIVVGSRDRADVRGSFLESVSNYVKHNAHCSVLIVHPPIDTKESQNRDSSELPTSNRTTNP
ncbi:MAG: universal stress protein [Cyanophyceae cyanobacterium]